MSSSSVWQRFDYLHQNLLLNYEMHKLSAGGERKVKTYYKLKTVISVYLGEAWALKVWS